MHFQSTRCSPLALLTSLYDDSVHLDLQTPHQPATGNLVLGVTRITTVNQPWSWGISHPIFSYSNNPLPFKGWWLAGAKRERLMDGAQRDDRVPSAHVSGRTHKKSNKQ